MEHTTIAVDLGKSVFQVAVSHHLGHVDEERRLSRDHFLGFFAQRPPSTPALTVRLRHSTEKTSSNVLLFL